MAYTVRCGGRFSKIHPRYDLGESHHNWDGYLSKGKEYRLTVQDCMKLQGWPMREWSGSKTAKYRLLGNTIPTNLTSLIAKAVARLFDGR